VHYLRVKKERPCDINQYRSGSISSFVVTKTIEWTVIPIGFLIFLALVGALTGVLTIITSSD